MRLLRSWPRHVPTNRPHVNDAIDRFVVDGYDYRRLATVGDDVLLIEWDLAVDPEQFTVFVDRCTAEPDRVRVAPYRLYYQYGDGVTWGDADLRPVWAHRRYTQLERLRWATDKDITCHLFGFGFVYLPEHLIAGFCAAETGPMGDSSFSHWHHDHIVPEVPIDWDCRPVHLNHQPLEVPSRSSHAHPAMH